ncbi:MAG: helix-turn-helix domain-containing protein [Oscillospiraceae bacterium]|nr:helix-turn-helix domain-containing protein [Oscillospiraceae bacterium]
MTNNYTSLDQLPLALSAEDVAQVLGISRANAYALMHSKGFPTLKIGKRMTVPKDKLIAWMEKQLAA